jgi:hypothetical protein
MLAPFRRPLPFWCTATCARPPRVSAHSLSLLSFARTPCPQSRHFLTLNAVMSVLGTSACSSTSVTVTHYRNANMAMTCTGTPAWTATITSTGCTPISDSVLGNIFAKILGGTCTPAGPVYTTNLYPNANGACTDMFSSWSMVASGICYDASFQNAYAAQLNLTGTNTANIYLGTPGGTVCSNTPTYANVNTQGTCFNMSAVLGSGGFNLMPAAAYTLRLQSACWPNKREKPKHCTYACPLEGKIRAPCGPWAVIEPRQKIPKKHK